MRDNLPEMLRTAAKEWREENKFVGVGETRYDIALDEAADAIEELQKRVPKTPHGRLGDLDVLAKQVEYERFHHAHTDGLAARHHVAEYGHFLKVIFDAPTILPADKEESDV